MNSTEMSGKVQPVLRSILEQFIQICDCYGLRYYLIDGSLLGAIRHKGFIPWDDDIDVGMPRPDYEKFCEVVHASLPANMYFVSYEDSLKEGSIAEIARLYCKDIKLKMDYFGNDQVSDAWMDIMIMYGMPKNALVRHIHYKRFYYLKGLARMGRIEHIGSRDYNLVEKSFIQLAKKVDMSKIINTEKILRRCVKLLKKYPYDESAYVIVVPSEYGPSEIVPYDSYEPSEIVSFEGLKASVPNKSDFVLSKLYGDYMKLPPIENRVSKHKVIVIDSN